jgi:electron transfer flavoprotein beta subunit
MVINAVDKVALEEALQLRDAFGGKVTVVTMSLPSAKKHLLEALAMGADEGILLTDASFGGADTLATSYTLSKTIQQLGRVDLVLLGNESADGATCQVPSQLGEWLGLPHLWNVFSVEPMDERVFLLKTKYENGHKEWRGELPLVLAVSRELVKPRHISAMGIIKAKNKPIAILNKEGVNDLQEECIGLVGSPTQPGEIMIPDMSRSGERLEGSCEEMGLQILEKIRAGGIVF